MSKTFQTENGRLRHQVPLSETAENRIRIPGGAVDSVMRLCTAEALLHEIRTDKKFMATCEKLEHELFDSETGLKIRQRIRMAESLLFAAEQQILNHIDEGNLKTVMNNCGRVNVVLTAVPVKMCDNIDHDDLRAIVRAATGSENCSNCIRSGDQVKRCELRKALDTVPGMEQRAGQVVAGMCPYGAMWGGAMDE